MDIWQETVLKNVKRESKLLNGDVGAVVEGAATEEEVAEAAEEDVEVVSMMTVLKNAGIVVKKDIWLTNVKNPEEKDKTVEDL